jgi:hypothetical protein
MPARLRVAGAVIGELDDFAKAQRMQRNECDDAE